MRVITTHPSRLPRSSSGSIPDSISLPLMSYGSKTCPAAKTMTPLMAQLPRNWPPRARSRQPRRAWSYSTHNKHPWPIFRLRLPAKLAFRTHRRISSSCQRQQPYREKQNRHHYLPSPIATTLCHRLALWTTHSCHTHTSLHDPAHTLSGTLPTVNNLTLTREGTLEDPTRLRFRVLVLYPRHRARFSDKLTPTRPLIPVGIPANSFRLTATKKPIDPSRLDFPCLD
jgi:hypothetical protein